MTQHPPKPPERTPGGDPTVARQRIEPDATESVPWSVERMRKATPSEVRLNAPDDAPGGAQE